MADGTDRQAEAAAPVQAGPEASPASAAPEVLAGAGPLSPRHVIALQRSAAGRGDYAVEPGNYGVKAGERVRIECATGRAVGIVRAE